MNCKIRRRRLLVSSPYFKSTQARNTERARSVAVTLSDIERFQHAYSALSLHLLNAVGAPFPLPRHLFRFPTLDAVKIAIPAHPNRTPSCLLSTSLPRHSVLDPLTARHTMALSVSSSPVVVTLNLF